MFPPVTVCSVDFSPIKYHNATCHCLVSSKTNKLNKTQEAYQSQQSKDTNICTKLFNFYERRHAKGCLSVSQLPLINRHPAPMRMLNQHCKSATSVPTTATPAASKPTVLNQCIFSWECTEHLPSAALFPETGIPARGKSLPGDLLQPICDQRAGKRSVFTFAFPQTVIAMLSPLSM